MNGIIRSYKSDKNDLSNLMLLLKWIQVFHVWTKFKPPLFSLPSSL